MEAGILLIAFMVPVKARVTSQLKWGLAGLGGAPGFEKRTSETAAIGNAVSTGWRLCVFTTRCPYHTVGAL